MVFTFNMEKNKMEKTNNSTTAKRNQKSRKVMLSQPHSKNEKGKTTFPKSSKKNSKLATLRRSPRNKSKSSQSTSSKPKKAKARPSVKEKKAEVGSSAKKSAPKKRKSMMIKHSSRESAIKAFNAEPVKKGESDSDESSTISMPIQSSNGMTPETIKTITIIKNDDDAKEKVDQKN